MGCWSKWDPGGCGCATCDCSIPDTITVKDSYGMTALAFYATAPSWITETFGFTWPYAGAWVGGYQLPGQQVTPPCNSPPYPSPVDGDTPIRYALGVTTGDCVGRLYRSWGVTNAVTSASGFALIECDLTSNYGVSSTPCGGSCGAIWQLDYADLALDDCAPLPATVSLTESTALPGNPLGASVTLGLASEMVGPPPAARALPPLGARLASAARAAGRFAASGFRVADDATIGRRRSICAACPLWIASERRCSKCGCHTDWKIRSAAEHCPDDPPRW